MAHWIGICAAAGFFEEVVYRGYLFWYGQSLLGDSWPAVAAVLVGAAVVFMLCHLYEGRLGMIQVFITALVLGGLFLTTRSLLPLIVLHFAMDVNGGMISLRLARNEVSSPAAPPKEAPAG
jgi:membrane protease YdiL (CAAX protease family)